MKTFYKLILSLFVFATSPVVAQTAPADSLVRKAPTFLRLYPVELIVNELRVGIEAGTAPRQAIVIDVSYFWRSRDEDLSFAIKSGWAIKADYRFYNRNADRVARFFIGPNVMLKQQAYTQTRYTAYSTTSQDATRLIIAANLKMGFDIRLTRSGRPRLEYFTGIGARYKSIGETMVSRENGGYVQNLWLPNLLSGLVLKL